MYIRVIRGRFDTPRLAEVLRLVEQELLPALTQAPGFRGFYGGVDRISATLGVVSLWDTAAQVISQQRPAFQALGVRFEAPDAYEVVAHA
jgi:hypothetical protein